MGRSTPTFRDFTKEWSGECLRMLRALPEKERSALKNLLNVVSSRSDAGSLMLMVVHLKAELDDLKTAIDEDGG